MKVALCISGTPREFHQSFPSLKEKILDVLHPDIFVSFWDWQYRNKNDIQSSFALDHHKEFGSLKEVFDLYKSTGLLKFFETEVWDNEVEEFLRVPALVQKYGNIFARTVPANYKIFKANQLAINYANINQFEYDMIIKTRADLDYFNKIDENEIKYIIDNPDDKFIYIRKDSVNQANEVPAPNWNHDQFWFGNQKSMILSSLIVFGMERFIKKMERKAGELFLRENCRELDIEMKPSNIRYKLCREK